MRVASGVRPIVLGHLAEQQLAPRVPSGAGDARRGVDHDLAPGIDQPAFGERDQGEQRRRRIAAGVGHELGRGDARPGEFGEAVHGLGAEPKIGGQINRPHAGRAHVVHVAAGDAVRQAGEDELGARELRVVGLDEPLAFDGLARRRLGGGKGDGGPRVTGQEPQQLLPDVPGGPEDANGHPCMIMHSCGKLYSLLPNARVRRGSPS